LRKLLLKNMIRTTPRQLCPDFGSFAFFAVQRILHFQTAAKIRVFNRKDRKGFRKERKVF
jgi:hypothetical protein